MIRTRNGRSPNGTAETRRVSAAVFLSRKLPTGATMKYFAFALFVSAVQALPATVEVSAPADGPAAIRVAAGGDLQAALDRANPGDVIELASGATYTGNFVLPAKAGNRYTILRTTATPGLPDADGRITPA